MEGLSHLPVHPPAQPETSSLQPVQHPTASNNTQPDTGPPATSTDISMKVAPAGVDFALLHELLCHLGIINDENIYHWNNFLIDS